MRTLKLTIAYDGAAYAGWQLQPGRPTLQAALENAIAAVTGEHVRILGSGRTDAGVHALGQVAASAPTPACRPRCCCGRSTPICPPTWPCSTWPRRPRDSTRSPTSSATLPLRDLRRSGARVFRRHFAWHYRYGRLDADAITAPPLGCWARTTSAASRAARREKALSARSFGLSVERGRAGGEGPEVRGHGSENGRNSLPRLPSICDPDSNDLITIEIEANGFLYNMVRAIVGTLVEVGRSSRPESWPGEVLRSLDRRVAGPNAPPQGLCLVAVEHRPATRWGHDPLLKLLMTRHALLATVIMGGR